MPKHLDTGRQGEEIARDYLLREGYQILATNWRYHRAELDIIAQQQEILVFVEVKTTTSPLSNPSLAFHYQKQQLMAKAAIAYTHSVQHEWAIRFDLITITLLTTNYHRIEHFKDAFFPGLQS